nr:phosrestin-2-like [Onthophagus taurus]
MLKMTEDSGPSCVSESKPENQPSDTLSSQRVFKKTSPNNKLTLYLSSRDLVVSSGKVDKLHGVLLIDPDFVQERKIYGQITLTFRYGREDEEVMGLKFCNEAIMCLMQLYPPHVGSHLTENVTPLQDALLKRLGPNAYPFTMEITPLAPPSVQLVPAKEYSGAPIGTSYDVRAYIADKIEEKLQRRATVRMGIRVVQRAFAPPSPYLYSPSPAKEKRHKLALFCSKSVPTSTDVTQHFATSQQHLQLQSNTPRAATSEIQLEMRRLTEKKQPICDSEQKIDISERVEKFIDENGEKSTHVTFKEELKEREDDEEKVKVRLARSASISSEASSNNRHRSTCGGKRPSLAAFLAEVPAPRALVEKPFLLSDGKVELEARLNKGIYYHGEEIDVICNIRNNSNKAIRRVKVFVVQHVDVCMFSNGKFKNIVALINSKNDCPLLPGSTTELTYTLLPMKGSTKNWIALEDSYTKSGTSLASSVTSSSSNPEDRNVFAIYVSYYVKVKLVVSVMGGDVSIKLPFTLIHTCDDYDSSPMVEMQKIVHRKSVVEDVKQEKDGT